MRESIVWGVRNGNWPAVGSVPFDKISGKRLQEQYVRAWKLSECYTPEDDHAFSNMNRLCKVYRWEG